ITATPSQGRRPLKYLLFALVICLLAGCDYEQMDRVERVRQEDREFQQSELMNRTPKAKVIGSVAHKATDGLAEGEWIVKEVHMPSAYRRIFLLYDGKRTVKTIEVGEKDDQWETACSTFVGDRVDLLLVDMPTQDGGHYIIQPVKWRTDY
ncbi:MAG: hypothetical protein Q7K33_03010, partial [Candidatus Berkelbacteria bacterium]|nr:hypothetical protein [Candidatus Berkelbacteria bacterium]